MESVKRDLVGRLAVSESARALEVARGISDPWFRCQALAHVAWHLQDERQRNEVIGEAVTAAFEQDEPNRIVSVASWAVRVMVKNGDRRLASVVDELLNKIELEPNAVRQADALLILFQAVYYEPQLRELVLASLLRACEQMKSWKRPRILSETAMILAIDDSDRASHIVDLIGESRQGRKARRDLIAGKWPGPNEFFPYYAKP